MNQIVTLIEVIDPLDTRQRQVSKFDWRPGLTLDKLYPTPLGAQNIAVSVNGAIIPYDDRKTFVPAPGDFVVVAPIAEGDKAKGILRIVAMIALAVYAPMLAGQLSFALGGGMFLGSVTGLAMLEAGVMIAGGMLINALLPPPKPKKVGDQADSASYGIDGPKNTALEGIPVPVPYGTFRMAGNVIATYVVNGGSYTYQVVNGQNSDRSEQVQHLHMLLNMGEGPVSSISQIKLNDQPIEEFLYRPKGSGTDAPAYEFYTYLGTPTQTAPMWFDRTITSRNVQQEFTTGWTTFNLTGPADVLRVDLFSPIGIFRLNDEGDIRETYFDIELQYKRPADATWLPLQGSFGNSSAAEQIVPRTYTETNPWSGASYSMTYRLTGSERRVGNTLVNGEGVVVADYVTVSNIKTDGIYRIQAGHQGAWRRSITSIGLAEDVYQVRFRRLTAKSTSNDMFNECHITDINEVRDETVGYRNTALLALKLRVTDKLNSIPNVTALVDGRVISTWNDATGAWVNAHSKNPAWIALDALTHSRYGGGASLSRFDLEMWKEWARHCTSSGLEFNGVFDVSQTIWDAAQSILRCGHAQIVPVGTKLSVAIERAQTHSMVFSVANMVEGSFKINWLPVTERANEIEVSYQDAADNYKQRTIKAVNAAAATAGLPQRTSAVTLLGVTSAQQAWNEATLMMNMNRYVLQTAQWSSPAEAIGCAPGDVVMVQHDMPQWGFAGRMEAGSSSTVLQLDRQVTMEYGKTYEALIHFSQVSKATGTVASVTGTSILLNGYTGTTAVRRLVVGSVERTVLSVYQSGANYGVVVDNATGITAGATYTLYNTDELVSRAVTNPTTVGSPTATVTSITLSSAAPAAPAQYANWTFGETTKAAKPFRIRSIGGNDPAVRDIVAIEYNASVYDPAGAAPTPIYSTPDQTVKHATILGVREELKLVGTTYKPVVTISFGPIDQQASYSRSEVLAAIGSGPFRSLGFGVSEMSLEAAKGDLIYFRVIARDLQDRPAEASSAPSTIYRVDGETSAPGTVSGLASAFEDAGIRITWNAPNVQDWLTTIVRQGADFASGTTVFSALAPSCLLPFRPTGTTRYVVRHTFTSGQAVTTDGVIDVVVSAPATPTPTTSQVQSGSVALRWGALRTSQPLKLIEVRVGATYAGSTLYDNYAGTAEGAVLSFQGDGSRTIWVRAQDVYGNWGTQASVTVSVTGIGNGDMTVPTTPTGLAATTRFGTNYLTWTAPSYSAGGGHAETLVYGATNTGTAPTFASAVLIGSVPAPGTSFADSAQPASVRHYWIVHVSKTGVSSAAGGGTNGVSITTARLANADMDNAVIDTTKFAAGIEPVTIVSSVPGTKSTNSIFNTTDGKLYRWDGSAYVATVQAVDIAGDLGGGNMLLNSSFEADSNADGTADSWTFASSGSVGTVTRSLQTVVASYGTKAQRVSSTALASGAFVQMTQLVPCEPGKRLTISSYISGTVGNNFQMFIQFRDASNAVLATVTLPATALTATRTRYTLTSANVAPAGTVSATIFAGRLLGAAGGGAAYIDIDNVQAEVGDVATAYAPRPDEIMPGAITSTEIADNAVTSAKIVAGAIVAGKIAAGTITATEIAAETITANEIAANAITASEIAADAVTAGKIQAGAVTTDKLAANSVVASKLLVSNFTNIFPDFNTEDPDFYSTANGATYGRPLNASNTLGTRYLNITSLTAVSVESGWFPIEASADYYCAAAAWLAAATAGSGTSTVAIQLGSVDATGAITSTRTVTIATRTDSTNQALLSTNIVTAANERRARIVFSRSSGTAAARGGGVLVQRRNNGALIVDGAITTNHMTAGTINGDRISAGTLDAAKITAGTINTDRLVVGAVTANSSVSGISNSASNSGTATGASIADTSFITITPTVSQINLRGRLDVDVMGNSTTIEYFEISVAVKVSGTIKWSVLNRIKTYARTSGGGLRQANAPYSIYIVDTGTPGVSRQYDYAVTVTGFNASDTAVSLAANGYLVTINAGIQWYENKV